jgi:hypothetical protein
MPTSFSGGCACGAIRYSAEGEPLYSVNCHCRDCQHETGSAYAPVLGVPTASFRVTQGSPRYFEVKADSGRFTRRAFCGECGSTLFGAGAEFVSIRAGSLDDPSIFRPSQDIYTSSAQRWDYMNPDLPKASKLPDK